jgi:MinD-like ATPase involved in chromosome partitioning or flagellar assembly
MIATVQPPAAPAPSAPVAAATPVPVAASPAAPRALTPLVAVCGLCGGAGATSLAYLLAVFAARANAHAAVLACDTGGPTAALAAYVGARSHRSLPAAAQMLASGAQLDAPLFAQLAANLRLIASAPEALDDADGEAVEFIFEQARGSHTLTVADCGTLTRPIERRVARSASHVAWVLPATVSGARRAAAALAVADPTLPGREIVVARHDAGERKAPMRELTALADSRNAPLVLMPHIPDLAEADVADALDAAHLTLTAFEGVLHR